MLATEEVLKTSPDFSVAEESLRQHKLELLKDDEYQDLIRIRTTNVQRIKKRIELAANYLYGVDYE